MSAKPQDPSLCYSGASNGALTKELWFWIKRWETCIWGLWLLTTVKQIHQKGTQARTASLKADWEPQAS